MSPQAARSAALAALLSALLSTAAPAAPAPAGPAADRPVAIDDPALAQARERAARADADVEALKRTLGPGRIADPLPDLDRRFGLDALRADYLAFQVRAAGYRSTLGDQHPTLVAAEKTLADLRAQILDAARRALADRTRDAAEARATVAGLEGRGAPRVSVTAAAASPTPDVTGSIAAPPRPPAPRSASSLALPGDAASDMVRAAPPEPATSDGIPLSLRLAGLAAAVLAIAGGALRLLRRRPARALPAAARGAPTPTTEPVRTAEPEHAKTRVEPALGPVPAAAVPVLADLVLPAHGIDVAGTVAGAPGSGVALGAATLHAALRAAIGPTAPGARSTVIVAAVGGLSMADADDAALALTLAAAAAGGRALLMEARAAGRLRGAAVAGDAAPMLIEAGGAARTFYRVGTDAIAAAVLPSDGGEAEAAAAAALRPDTHRLRGLAAFDTVVLVGDDPAALAPGADLLLLAAPAGTPAAAVAAAAARLGAAGRPCAALLVARSAAPAQARTVPAPRRRRPASDAAPAARLGLRGSFDAPRRRVGA